MDKWRIIGAEAASGEERSIEVNARDETAAREAARMLGMLVAHVERLAAPTGPVLQYRTPGLTNRPASVEMATVADQISDASPRPAVRHAAILSGAAAAIGVAKMLYAVGIVVLMIAVAGLVATIAVAIRPEDRVFLPPLLILTISAAIAGLAMIAAAAALQLLAAIGLAVRDVAANVPTPLSPSSDDHS